MFLETNKVEIGKIIKECRHRKKLTQCQLAELIDLNEKQIYRIESGLNYPTYITFAKLLKALEIDAKVFETKQTQEHTPLIREIINLLRNSNNTELKTYLDVLTVLKRNMRNIQKQ